MPFTEEERALHEKQMAEFVEKHRPAVEIRNEVDLAFRIDGQSIVIYEVRRHWKDASRRIESAIAKTTFVRTTWNWKVFWMRRDLKWHSYPVQPIAKSLTEFLDLVEEDVKGCFWG